MSEFKQTHPPTPSLFCKAKKGRGRKYRPFPFFVRLGGQKREGIVGWVLFLFSLVPAAVDSNRIPWPVLCEPALTSAFGDYRPGHFHSGIDMKTWGRTGFPVVSEADGHVARIGVSTRGYGKALYIELQSGEFRVYGHLERFSGPVEARILDEQYKAKRYSLQLYFKADEFPVKKGDTLALSGETGVGYPHLHYEHRNRDNVILNPLHRGIAVRDRKAPVLEKLAVKPLSPGARIDGAEENRFYPFRRAGKDSFVIAAPLRIEGIGGFAVEGYDQADAADNRFGLYRVAFYSGDSLIYASDRDSFRFDETQKINLDYDPELVLQDQGRFINLFVEEGNTLPFYGAFAEGSGLFRTGEPPFGEGIHRMTIEARDAMGNTSRAYFKVLVPKAQLLPSPAADLSPAAPPATPALSDTSAEIALEIRRALLTVRARLTLHSKVPPALFAYADSLSLALPPLQKEAAGRYRLVFKPEFKGSRNFSLVMTLPEGGSLRAWKRHYRLLGLKKGEGGEVASLDGVAALSVAEKTVVHDAFLGIEPLERFPALQKKTALVPVTGTAYRVFPGVLYYDRPVRVSVRNPKVKGGLLAAWQGASQGWRFFSADYDDKTAAYTGKLKENLPFTVMADTVPPSVVFKSPAAPRDTLGTPFLLARVCDTGAGIGSDADVEARIDGEWALSEFDFETGAVKILYRSPRSGPHLLALLARDNAGNETRAETFFILP